VVSDGSKILAGPDEAGDEAFMLASLLPGIPVVAGSRRVISARLALRRFNADLLVLDDGFQHLALKRDLDVVLFPATAPFGTGRVFPGGDLREPVSAIGRADAGVITGLDPSGCGIDGHYEDAAELARAKIHRLFPDLPLFLSRTRPAGLKWWDFEGKGCVHDGLDAHCKKALPVWAFCAIAAPERFFSLCRSCFSDVVGETPFRDHFVFQPRDLQLLFQRARNAGAKALVCTEKDWVKIEPLLGSFSGSPSRGMKIGALLISLDTDRAFDDLVIRAAKGKFKGTGR
jgi:tetraacyldisaccharide 4'-kinase